MAKINPEIRSSKAKHAESETMKERGEKMLSLISSGLQDVRALADIYDTVSSTAERSKTVDTDNAVKLCKAEADADKEKNRHDEEMMRIKQNWIQISNVAEDREKRFIFIKSKIDMFQEEYYKYLNMDQEEFMSDTVTKRLESLRKIIKELTVILLDRNI